MRVFELLKSPFRAGFQPNVVTHMTTILCAVEVSGTETVVLSEVSGAETASKLLHYYFWTCVNLN